MFIKLNIFHVLFVSCCTMFKSCHITAYHSETTACYAEPTSGPERERINTLQWRHNETDGVSNHLPHDCLLNSLFMRRWKKTQSSASLAFVRGIHRGAVNSPHKWPVTRAMFPFDDVIMKTKNILHVMTSYASFQSRNFCIDGSSIHVIVVLVIMHIDR